MRNYISSSVSSSVFRSIALFTAVLIMAASHAVGQTTKVYKIVNKDGSVSYSDQASQSAEELDIAPVSTIPALDIKSGANITRPDKANKQPYDTFKILAPENDSAFNSGSGSVTVTTSLAPALARRHMLSLYLDGTLISTQSSPSFQLDNIDRGTHSLTLKAINSAGKVLQSTSSTFTLHRPKVRRIQIN